MPIWYKILHSYADHYESSHDHVNAKLVSYVNQVYKMLYSYADNAEKRCNSLNVLSCDRLNDKLVLYVNQVLYSYAVHYERSHDHLNAKLCILIC